MNRKNFKTLALIAVYGVLFGGCATDSPRSDRNPAAFQTPEATIILTSFEPEDEKPQNNSEKVAAALESTNGSSKIRYVRCANLPLAYDAAAKKAQECMNAAGVKPDYVISLGEGYCEMHLETIAFNEDNTWTEDNLGEVRVRKPIDKTAPKKLGLTLPQNHIFCGLRRQDARVFPSTDGGRFVHNNLSFRLANYFRGETIPYGFIHVPAHLCAKGGKPEKTAESLHEAFLYLVDNDGSRKKRNHEAFPVNASEYKSFAEHHPIHREDSCVREFYQSLDRALRTVE